MTFQASASPRPAHRHRTIVRLSSLGVASVLALLIGTSVVPPLVADQSDRAVVNAPVTLLTAPIPGDVEAIPVRAGERIRNGDLVARIGNPRIDRASAIQLDSRITDLRERSQSTTRKLAANLTYLATLDRTLQQQSAAMAQAFRGQADELRSRIASAQASAAEKKALLDRQTELVARNIASPMMVRSTSQAHAAAHHEGEAAQAKLGQKLAQSEHLSRGVYAGDELTGLAELSQRRLAIQHDAHRLGIEEAELNVSIAEQQRLLERENKRLATLSRTEVTAPGDGVIFNVGAGIGRNVSAGDSLAALVDCDRSFVVAIFSYRQAQNLHVGSQVEIGTGAGGSRPGRVIEILPKTSDKLDAAYAVPFPQTERRELYVLVKPDGTAGEGAEGPAACDVGRWVTVTRQAGWVPSTSVVWRQLEQGTSQAVQSAAGSVSGLLQMARVAAGDWAGGKPAIASPEPAVDAVTGSIPRTPEANPPTPAVPGASSASTPPAPEPSPAAREGAGTRPTERQRLGSSAAPLPPKRPSDLSANGKPEGKPANRATETAAGRAQR